MASYASVGGWAVQHRQASKQASRQAQESPKTMPRQAPGYNIYVCLLTYMIYVYVLARVLNITSTPSSANYLL